MIMSVVLPATLFALCVFIFGIIKRKSDVLYLRNKPSVPVFYRRIKYKYEFRFDVEETWTLIHTRTPLVNCVDIKTYALTNNLTNIQHDVSNLETVFARL